VKIIADCCSNHCGDRKTMEKMVRAAKIAGVDAVKFQSFKADMLRKDWPDYENEYKYYKKHELSEDDHYFLLNLCEKLKIEFLTAVFDLETVNFLRKLGLKRVKIASPDCNNWALIDACLEKFDHVIISTGMHSSEEVLELARYLETKRAKYKVTALHCISLYPTPLDKINMLRMAWLMKLFTSVGFSDHTLGTVAGKIALSLGAACVEKHFSLDRTMPGKDQKMSATVDELKELVDWREKVQKVMYCPEEFVDKEARRYIGKWSNA